MVLEKRIIKELPLEEFAFERIINMNVLRKNLLFMAAATTIWTAALQPGVVSAQTSGIGGDGNTRLLWKGTDGSISLWELDLGLNFLFYKAYGPFYGWQPVAITTARNNNTYILWKDTNNYASVWAVDANLNLAFSNQYGPFYGWVPETLSADTNGNSTLRLIWRSSTGEVSVWFLNPDLSLAYYHAYGPFFGFNPGPAGAAAAKPASGATAVGAPTPNPEAAAAMKSAEQ